MRKPSAPGTTTYQKRWFRDCFLSGSFSRTSLSPQTQAPFHQEVISMFNKLVDFVNLVPFEYLLTEIYLKKRKEKAETIYWNSKTKQDS